MSSRMFVFCTSHLTGKTGMEGIPEECTEVKKRYEFSGLERYIDWFAYYSKLRNADLFSFHDGELPQSAKDSGLNFIELTPRLGRSKINIHKFPGWRRGFSSAIKFAIDNGYDKIVHIESDVAIKHEFLAKYREEFNKSGYAVGWCKRYMFIEPSLQVINDLEKAKEIVKYYSLRENLYAEVETEHQLSRFNPAIKFTKGDRIEHYGDESKDLEYYAQWYSPRATNDF